MPFESATHGRVWSGRETARGRRFSRLPQVVLSVIQSVILGGDDMNAATLAARAHDFQKSGDWGGAAKCYEEILSTPLAALDRGQDAGQLNANVRQS